MARRKFKHPTSGAVGEFDTLSSRILAGLFGIFYFPFKGAWMTSFGILVVWAIPSFVFAPLLILVWIGMVIATPDLLAKSYIGRGYHEVDAKGVSIYTPPVIDDVIAGQIRSIMPNSKAMQHTDQLQRWNILTEYDEDAAAAAARVKSYGVAAMDEFRDAYLTINDRNQINSIADKVIRKYAMQGALDSTL